MRTDFEDSETSHSSLRRYVPALVTIQQIYLIHQSSSLNSHSKYISLVKFAGRRVPKFVETLFLAACIHLASFLGVSASPLASSPAFQRPGSSQSDVGLGRRAGEIAMPVGITILNDKPTARYAIVFQGTRAFIREGNQVSAERLPRRFQHGVKSLNMQVKINLQNQASIASGLQIEGAHGCTWIIKALNHLSIATSQLGISEEEENAARAWITSKEKELKITESCGKKIARPATAIYSPTHGNFDFSESPTSSGSGSLFSEDQLMHMGA
ncbi:hypothetical protein GGU11DRAFT_876422 [Lentinula aff. detonsa]|nr:hypothetical protein GGU11DRAFT_876422 [Lentinula aff. detonsa]